MSRKKNGSFIFGQGKEKVCGKHVPCEAHKGGNRLRRKSKGFVTRKRFRWVQMEGVVRWSGIKKRGMRTGMISVCQWKKGTTNWILKRGIPGKSGKKVRRGRRQQS